MRALGLILLALLLLAGCGDDSPAATEPSPSPSPSSAESVSPTPQGPAPTGELPEAQPPRDGPLPDTRTGALPMPGAACVVGSSTAEGLTRFDGTIIAIGASGATFEVNEVFAGDVPGTVTVDLGPATTSRASESSPSYFVGTRLLVSTRGPTALGCGDTRYFDEETAAAWRS